MPCAQAVSSASSSSVSSIAISRNSPESKTSPQSRHSTYSASSSRATMRTLGCLQTVFMGESHSRRLDMGQIVSGRRHLSTATFRDLALPWYTDPMSDGKRVSLEDVRRVAELAHLELTADEEPRMRRDLNAILDYVAQFSELDTSQVAPMAQVSEVLAA